MNEIKLEEGVISIRAGSRKLCVIRDATPEETLIMATAFELLAILERVVLNVSADSRTILMDAHRAVKQARGVL